MPLPIAAALIPIISALATAVGGHRQGTAVRKQEADAEMELERFRQEQENLRALAQLKAQNPTLFSPTEQKDESSVKDPDKWVFSQPQGKENLIDPRGWGFDQPPGEPKPEPQAGIPTGLRDLLMNPEILSSLRDAEMEARRMEIAKNRMASSLYERGPEALGTLGLDELLGQLMPGASGVREVGKERTFRTQERLGAQGFSAGESALERQNRLEIAGMPARGGAQTEHPAIKRIYEDIKDAEDTIGDIVTKIGDDPRSVSIGRSVINGKNYQIYSALRNAKAMGGNPEAVAKRFARSAKLISDPGGTFGEAGGMPVSLFRVLTMPQDQQAKYGGYPELAALYYDLLGEQAPVETSPVPGRGQTGSSYFSGQGASEQQMLEMIRSSEEAAGLDE